MSFEYLRIDFNFFAVLSCYFKREKLNAWNNLIYFLFWHGECPTEEKMLETAWRRGILNDSNCWPCKSFSNEQNQLIKLFTKGWSVTTSQWVVSNYQKALSAGKWSGRLMAYGKGKWMRMWIECKLKSKLKANWLEAVWRATQQLFDL